MSDCEKDRPDREDEAGGKDQAIDFTTLAAHQLKSPIAAAGSLLQTLIEEFEGPLNPRQRDVLARANQRLEEALQTMGRMLSFAQMKTGDEGEKGVAEMAAIIRRTQTRFAQNARARNISFYADMRLEPAYVRAAESAMAEILNALVDNALKYTPDNGTIRLTVSPAKTEGYARVSVEDSGIGVPREEREKVFEKFFRAASARKTKISGVGLGLALVKAAVQAAGGRIWVEKSDLGGADFSFELPQATSAEIARIPQGLEAARKKVVIIGGVAAGPKVASKVIRLKPETEVTIIERGALLSYAGCGLPYYVSGVVREQRDLLATPLGAVRDPVFLRT